MAKKTCVRSAGLSPKGCAGSLPDLLRLRGRLLRAAESVPVLGWHSSDRGGPRDRRGRGPAGAARTVIMGLNRQYALMSLMTRRIDLNVADRGPTHALDWACAATRVRTFGITAMNHSGCQSTHWSRAAGYLVHFPYVSHSRRISCSGRSPHQLHKLGHAKQKCGAHKGPHFLADKP